MTPSSDGRGYRLALAVLALLSGGCAAPVQRPATQPGPAPAPKPPAAVSATLGRPAVGVAFGGGSARGIAHVGVIRWLEEHRIPVDVAAGTSMGGLVGGAFATGMDAKELEAFIVGLDWDQLFGSSSFAHKNIRRKTDARAFPARLEFGIKGGLVAPSALNNGEHVELLLGRLTAPYFAIDDFDALPTPFRVVAVDLLSAKPVILGSGSLADAMRATMSLPLIFPPVEQFGQVLIDGGTMNNVPADVVRDMGAGRVIAINVGDLSDREALSYSMFSVAGSTIDAMMRASTKRALTAADVVIPVTLTDFGSLDWRRATDLIEEGYKAAEAMRDQLLPLAVSETEYAAWRDGRRSRRLTELPVPTYVQLDGFAGNDAKRLNTLLERHLNVPVDIAIIEREIGILAGLDRYQTVTWHLVREADRGVGLSVRGRLKSYAPPFMMLGVNLENTTSADFRITLTGRYLAYDVVGSGSELRIDGTIGSDPSAGFELYRPLGSSPLFLSAVAGVGKRTLNFISDDAILARYRETASRVGLNAGINLGARSDLRAGAYVGRTTATIEIGDPSFPELRGSQTGAALLWRVDTQDSPVVPSKGVRSEVQLSRIFSGPDASVGEESVDLNYRVTQLSAAGTQFWSRGPRNRLFFYGGLGTSFDSTALPTDQFALGTPFRLGAYDTGELRGSQYYVATAGYLRRIGRLPDFVGGPIFVGGWLENGDAFENWGDAGWRSNGGAGIVMDTLIGPVLLAGSWSFDGRWRTYLGIGRMFR